MHGALISAIVSALFIGLVSLYAEQREDTAIGAIWAVGMAIGLVFLARTPSYVDPMSYIWGDILLISRGDLWLIGALDLVVVVLCIFFYNKLLAICFDEEFPRLRGVRSELHYLMLLCLTALTVVLLVDVVGIVLVIALLTLPAAVAGALCASPVADDGARRGAVHGVHGDGPGAELPLGAPQRPGHHPAGGGGVPCGGGGTLGGHRRATAPSHSPGLGRWQRRPGCIRRATKRVLIESPLF